MQRPYTHEQNVFESLKNGLFGGVLGMVAGIYSGIISLPPHTPVVMAIPKSIRPMIRHSFSLGTTLFLYSFIADEYIYYLLKQNKENKSTFDFLATVPTWKQTAGNGVAGTVSGLVFALTNFEPQRRSLQTTLSTAATFGVAGLALKYYFVRSYKKAYQQYQHEQYLERKEFEDKNLQEQIKHLENKLKKD